MSQTVLPTNHYNMIICTDSVQTLPTGCPPGYCYHLEVEMDEYYPGWYVFNGTDWLPLMLDMEDGIDITDTTGQFADPRLLIELLEDQIDALEEQYGQDLDDEELRSINIDIAYDVTQTDDGFDITINYMFPDKLLNDSLDIDIALYATRKVNFVEKCIIPKGVNASKIVFNKVPKQKYIVSLVNYTQGVQIMFRPTVIDLNNVDKQ